MPLTYVNYTFQDIELIPQFHHLSIVGQSVFTKNNTLCWGYNCNGLIIYRFKTEGTYDDFRVYDATCPHCLGNTIFTINTYFPDEAHCAKCGSIFTMHGDYMLQGPARHPLRMLRSSFINGDLHIY